MTGITPERRAQLSRAGRIGGRMRWARHPEVKAGIFDAAHDAFRRSFLKGHSCKACPRVEIDQTMPEAQIRRAAEALRRAHYSRLAQRSAAKRGAQ